MQNQVKTILLITGVSLAIIFSACQKPIDSTKDDILALQSRVDAMQKKLDSLSNALSTANGNINALNKRVDSVVTALRTINITIDSLRTSINTNNGDIASMQLQIQQLQKKLDELLAELNLLLAMLQPKTTNISNLNWTSIISGYCYNIISTPDTSQYFLSRLVDVLKSTNGGQSWTATNWTLPVVRSGTSLTMGAAYSTFGSGQVILSALDNGWYTSNDFGMSYLQSGPIGFGTGSVCILPLASGRCIATQGGFARGIYKSEGPNNTVWTNKFSGIDSYDFAVSQDSTIYTASTSTANIPNGGFLLKSTDRGENWSVILTQTGAIWSVECMKDSLIWADNYSRLYVKQANDPSMPAPRYTFNPSASNEANWMTYDQKHDLIILTSYYSGIFLSSDHGMTWINYKIPGVSVYFVNKLIGKRLFVTTTSGLYSTVIP